MSSYFQFDVGGSTPIVVNVPDRMALAETVRARMRGSQGFALATINLDHLVKLRASEWLWRTLSSPRCLAGHHAGCALILPGWR